MKYLIAALVACICAPFAFGQVVSVDARSSAKFVKPGKVRVAMYPSNCGPRDAVAKTLTDKYGEDAVWEQASSRGHVAELWQGETSWSYTITTSDNTTCLIDSGARKSGMSG